MSDSIIAADVLGGRYSPGESALHKINPNIKLWAGMLMIVAVALADLQTLCILMLISIGCLKLAGLSFANIFRGLRHFAFFFFVLVLFPAIFSDGTPLLIPTYIPFSLSIEGLVSGGTAVLRFIVIVLISMILTRTIHPLDIVKSMENMIPKKYISDGPLYDFFRVGLMSMQVIPYLFGEVEKFAVTNRPEWKNVRGLKKYSRMIALVLPFLIHIFKSIDQMEVIIDSGQKT